MAKHIPIAGSYWAQYPIPENPQRCFARRTLHEAFGGNPTLSIPAPRRRRSTPWACAVLAAGAATLTVLAYGMHH